MNEYSAEQRAYDRWNRIGLLWFVIEGIIGIVGLVAIWVFAIMSVS